MKLGMGMERNVCHLGGELIAKAATATKAINKCGVRRGDVCVCVCRGRDCYRGKWASLTWRRPM